MAKRPEGSLISYFSNRVKKDGGINLAQGTPGFPPPAPLLELLKKRAENPNLHQYPPGNGNFKLLDLIRRRFSSVGQVELDNLLIVQGATEGIFLTFFYLTTLLRRPFAALSFDPVYESYPRLAGMFDVPFIYADFEADLSVDFQTLERIIQANRVRVVFVTSPGNPLGKTWSREEVTRLVELSVKHGFYILFDAVYKDIYFEEEPFDPVSLNYEKLFYIDSFSKMLSITGWRIGYIIASREHMKKLRGMHDYTGLCAPSVLQAVIAEYLSAHGYGGDYTETVRTRCRRSYRYMKEKLTELGFGTVESSGGYFLWASLPGGGGFADAFDFASALYREVKVGVVPGENFSLRHRNHIRMNIGMEMPVMEEAVELIKRFRQRNNRMSAP
jgi:aspartate/methionine/tyrosine aminotransferase